ncbi:hypothetical protein DPMN_052618 [Dreissena polymorpha]|uniref:Uncharacterized protein n=1 Tax=Dreissena polymorpha TaxID=45954 RepID=A0A9D4CLB1_DREPO|nr:hypothetical protein DPMN_052618 [Dreissena polymorpha]
MFSTNIISMDAAVKECFGPLSHKHSSGSGPTMVINHCVSVDASSSSISSRLSHSQLDALLAAWLSLWIAPLLSLPVAPSAVITLHTDWEQKPLAPTSTGNSKVRQPRCLQRSRSSEYLAFFLS